MVAGNGGSRLGYGDFPAMEVGYHLSKGAGFFGYFISLIMSNAISQTVIFFLHCRNGRIL